MPLQQGKPLLPSGLSTGVQGDLQEQTSYRLPKEGLRLTSLFPVTFPSALPAGCSFTYFVLVGLLSSSVAAASMMWTGIQKKHLQILPLTCKEPIWLPFCLKNDTPLFKHVFLFVFFFLLRLTRHDCHSLVPQQKVLGQLAARSDY